VYLYISTHTHTHTHTGTLVVTRPDVTASQALNHYTKLNTENALQNMFTKREVSLLGFRV